MEVGEISMESGYDELYELARELGVQVEDSPSYTVLKARVRQQRLD